MCYNTRENTKMQVTKQNINKKKDTSINEEIVIKTFNKENFKPDILYEDDYCLVINKPAGIMSHPVKANVSPASILALGEGLVEISGPYTISDWMRDNYPESAKIDEERPGIVHRLDRDTSGCMLLVKDAGEFNKYKTQFQDHSIKKVYLAIVSGLIKQDTGIIDAPIARARSDFRKKEVKNEFTKDYRGELREALTRYKVIERIGHGVNSFSLIECLPMTGRTHQIRVHLRSIRHPILGDQLYGSRESGTQAPRQMLHAKSLEFTSFKRNDEGEKIKVKIKMEAPIPQDMAETLEKIKKMC